MQEQRKASNTTTSEIVLESLREQIINGTLQPQEKLVEAEIAQKFGLSRGPVREALRQLAFEGLVDYCPNKGCTVALLSPQDAYEVFFCILFFYLCFHCSITILLKFFYQLVPITITKFFSTFL